MAESIEERFIELNWSNFTVLFKKEDKTFDLADVSGCQIRPSVIWFLQAKNDIQSRNVNSVNISEFNANQIESKRIK